MDLPRTVTVPFVAAADAVITRSAVNSVPVMPLLFQNLDGVVRTCVPLPAVADPLVLLISRE